MRAAGIVLLLLPSLLLAYQPASNITRGVYCPAGPLLSTAHWQRHGSGFSFTADEAHGGTCSIRVQTDDPKAPGAGVAQAVHIGQTEPAPLKIAGWSKAVGVAEDVKDHRYSLYVDLQYTDGTNLAMQLATFSGGTHDWEYSETVVEPEKPLASARVYAFLRWRTGTAYFDDLFIGAPGGPNLLKNAGFEPQDRTDVAAQETVYRTYAELHANAIHTYMSGEPAFWLGEDGKGNEDVRKFLATAAGRGVGVWLTPGHPAMPGFKDAEDPNFPQYVCVNGPWGDAWVKTLGAVAAYDFAAVSLVPDEYNWTNGELKDRYSKHADPRVVEYYKQMPAMCDCPVCRKLYEERFGGKLPALPEGMDFPTHDPQYLQYLQHRYTSTTDWIRRGAEAVKQANPRVRTDSLICVSPICHDQWWSVGVAWDRLGPETQLDFPTTDPYILLHNYLGDSTHWYVTETAAHLTGASSKRQCGIVLEASRLRPEYRELDPVEVYGSALSAVAHGAKELAWWHYDHITGKSPTTARPEVSRACVSGVYGMLEQADPWLGKLQPLKRVAYLHSRASDDFWRFYTLPEPSPVLTHEVNEPRYAAIAQKDMLYYLLRRGVPTDLYYLETVQESQLRDYPVVVVPFAFAIDDSRVALLERLARQGKTLLVLSELGALDAMGRPREAPALAELCGSGRDFGRGKIIYLPMSGYDLPAHRDNQKRTRTERIAPDPLAPERVAEMDRALQAAFGAEPWVLAKLPDTDLEATCLTNGKNELVVLTINWESSPAECHLRLPAKARGTLTGFRLGPDGVCRKSELKVSGPDVRVPLKAQEACLWRLVR